MLSIEVTKHLAPLWHDLIESEVTLNLPPLESHRDYRVRFIETVKHSDTVNAYRCEVIIAEHNRDVAQVKVSARDGVFAIRQCLQRAKRDLQRRSLFSNDRSRINKPTSREWTFA
ncbi:MAG: hypothetical protein AB8B48_14085 [Pseudomonadales bacterium]